MSSTAQATSFTQYSVDSYLADMGLDPAQEAYHRLEQAIVPLIPNTLAAGVSYSRGPIWSIKLSMGSKSVRLSLVIRKGDGLQYVQVDSYTEGGQHCGPTLTDIKVHPAHLDTVLKNMLGVSEEGV